MSELVDQVEPVGPEAVDTELGGNAGSVLERVVAARDARLAKEKHLDLPIPTWDGKLVARYEPPSSEKFDRSHMGRLLVGIGAHEELTVEQALDVLITTCTAITLVEGGEENRLSDGYNRPLARRLGLEGADGMTARQIALHMCGDAMKAQLHGTQVWGQLVAGSQEVEQQLAGESETSSG